jgi:hypothetical protein
MKKIMCLLITLGVLPLSAVSQTVDTSLIFEQKAGGPFVLVDTENLPHSDKWEFRSSPEGYCGEGYLVYTGPSMGTGHHTDPGGSFQGEPEDWLLLTVRIVEPGDYIIVHYSYHVLDDGDNDAWSHKIGDTREIYRTNCGGKGVEWSWAGEGGEVTTWIDRTVFHFRCDAGVHSFYIAGRSTGFGIDIMGVIKWREKEKLTQISMPDALTDGSTVFELSRSDKPVRQFNYIVPWPGIHREKRLSGPVVTLLGERLDHHNGCAKGLTVRNGITAAAVDNFFINEYQ